MSKQMLPKYSIPETTIAQQVGDEVVILNLSSERYYSLDEVGAAFWSLFAAGQPFDQIVQEMLEEFDVDENRLRNDLEALLDNLVQAGLIEVEL
jgi:hypothetical protein